MNPRGSLVACVAACSALTAQAASVIVTPTSDTFSVGEPVVIRITFNGITALRNYGVSTDPEGSNPPMGLFNSSEAGFGFPVARTDPARPFEHDLLLNKWVTLGTPGRYRVFVDMVINTPELRDHRHVASVHVNIVPRDVSRLRQSCEEWSVKANAAPPPVVLAADVQVGLLTPEPPPQRFAQQVLMYLQDEILVPCLLASATPRNLAPAITFREMDSLAAVRALRELLASPVPELSREARLRLGQLVERTKKDDVRTAAQDLLRGDASR